MTFDEVIAPCGADRFLATHWNRTPLQQDGARGRFAGLLDWDRLSHILEQHDIPSPRLRLVRGGTPLDPSRYRSGKERHERLDASALAACLAGGAALVLDGIDDIVPEIRTLAEDFEGALGAAVTVNLYAGMAGSRGFDLHWDSQDVMILQLAGRKQWRIHAPTTENPLRGLREEPKAPQGEPDWSGVVEDGGILYLPRGWWHAAEALDRPSLHLTVTIVPPRGIDFLEWLCGELRDVGNIRGDIPHAADAPARAAYFTGLTKEITAACAEPEISARFLGNWVSRRRTRPRVRLPVKATRSVSSPSTTVRLLGAGRLAIHRGENDKAWFDSGGQRWHCSAALKAALASLSGVPIVPAQFEGSLRGEYRRLLTALAIAGVVEVEESPTGKDV